MPFDFAGLVPAVLELAEGDDGDALVADSALLGER